MALTRRFRATVGKRPLVEALKTRYPKYNNAELEKLEELILAAVARAIADGKFVAFIDKLPSGEVELDALYVEDRAAEIVSKFRVS